MKKVLALAFVLLVCLALSAAASEDNWRFYAYADNGAGMYYSPYAHIGNYPGADDGVDAYDQEAAYGQAPDTTVWIVTEMGGRSYTRNLRGYTPGSYPVEYWIIYAMANQGYAGDTFRLYFQTASITELLPPETFSGMQWPYLLQMIRGPYAGATWGLSIPENANTTFWELTLPTIKSTSPLDDAAMISQGYMFTLTIGWDPIVIIPEPSSLLALGAGAAGLLGYAIRKRRG